MKVTFNRKALLEAVNVAVRATDDKAGQEILGFVLFEAVDGAAEVTLTGHDMILALQQKVLGTVTGGDAAFTLQGHLIKSIVSSCDADTCEIEFDPNDPKTNGFVQFTSGSYTVSLPTLPATQYPPMIKLGATTKFVTVNAQALKTAIKRVAFAVAVDNGKEALNGFLWDIDKNYVSVICTDARKLGYSQFEHISTSGKISAVIPARACRDIIALLPTGNDAQVTLQFDKKLVMMEFNGLTLASRLIDDPYVNWQAIVPDSFAEVITVKRADLLKSLLRAQNIAQFAGNYVKVAISAAEDLVRISSQDQKGVSDEEVLCSVDGNGMTIYLDVKDAIAGIQAMECTELKIFMNDPIQITKIVGDGLEDTDFQMLMPLAPK